jgi:hypothetical protein
VRKGSSTLDFLCEREYVASSSGEREEEDVVAYLDFAQHIFEAHSDWVFRRGHIRAFGKAAAHVTHTPAYPSFYPVIVQNGRRHNLTYYERNLHL